MKNKLIFFLQASLIVVFLLSALASHSQNFSLSGQLSERSSKQQIKGASLSLIEKSQQKTLKSVLTDESGLFRFNNIPTGNYDIIITAIGHKRISIAVSLEKADKNIGDVFMETVAAELTGITVIAKTASVSQKDDTTQYSSSQYKMNPDATTEDLVKKMPGISIDKNGMITAQGEQVKKVTVDGKDFFGNDATAALRNIPAGAVDKIQVFDRLSDQAQMTGIDDGNSQKSINIITKAGINNAQFGRIYAGAGTNQTYSAGGNVSFFKNERRISLVGSFNNTNQQNFGTQDLIGITGNSNSTQSQMSMGNFRPPGSGGETFTTDQLPGINTTNALGFNFSNKWKNQSVLTASYFFNQTHNNNLSLTRNNLFEGNLNTLRNSRATGDNFNHRINARLEWKLDSNNMIFIIPSLNFQNNRSDAFTDLNSFRNDSDSVFNAFTDILRNKSGYNLKNSLMFRHNFSNKNRILTATLNTTLIRNFSDNTIDAAYRFYDNQFLPLVPDSVQNQLTNNKTNGYILGGNITYNEPLGKKGKSQLQIEYNPSLQENKSNQQTLGWNGSSYSNFDSSLSNDFNSQIITHSTGMAYRLTPGKNEQMTIGVNYQNAELINQVFIPSFSGNRFRFRNVLPYGFWRKKISNYTNFRMFFRTSTSLPAINQLQNVVSLSSGSGINMGNKELVQSFNIYTGGRVNYTNTKNNRSVFSGIFYQRSDDFISNAIYIAATDSVINEKVLLKKGSQLVKPVNLDGYRIVRSYFNFSFPIKKLKSTVNGNTAFMYNKMPGLINNINTVTNTFQYNMGLSFVSNVSEYVDYNISYNTTINNAQTTGNGSINNNYLNHNISVVFNLLSKKGWFFQNDYSCQIFKGLTAGFDRTFNIWTASAGKKFFKEKKGELKLTVFDILKQNQSVVRTVSNTYLEDVTSRVLSQYVMLSFSYNLKNFGTPAKTEKKDEFIPKVGYPNQ